MIENKNNLFSALVLTFINACALLNNSKYIDPIIDSDENLTNLSEITLSYTFFKKYEKEVRNKKTNLKSINLL